MGACTATFATASFSNSHSLPFGGGAVYGNGETKDLFACSFPEEFSTAVANDAFASSSAPAGSSNADSASCGLSSIPCDQPQATSIGAHELSVPSGADRFGLTFGSAGVDSDESAGGLNQAASRASFGEANFPSEAKTAAALAPDAFASSEAVATQPSCDGTPALSASLFALNAASTPADSEGLAIGTMGNGGFAAVAPGAGSSTGDFVALGEDFDADRNGTAANAANHLKPMADEFSSRLEDELPKDAPTNSQAEGSTNVTDAFEGAFAANASAEMAFSSSNMPSSVAPFAAEDSFREPLHSAIPAPVVPAPDVAVAAAGLAPGAPLASPSELSAGWPSWLPRASHAELAGSAKLFSLLADSRSTIEHGGVSEGPDSAVTIDTVVDLVREVAATVLGQERCLSTPITGAEFARIVHGIRCLVNGASATSATPPTHGAHVTDGAEAVPYPLLLAAQKARASGTADAVTPATKARARAEAEAQEAAALLAEAQEAEVKAKLAKEAAATKAADAQAAAQAAKAELAAKALRSSDGSSVGLQTFAMSAFPSATATFPSETATPCCSTPSSCSPGSAALTADTATIPNLAPSTRLPPPTQAHRQRYSQIFNVLHAQRELAGVPPDRGFSVLRKSGLAADVLQHVWNLADVDKDGLLNLEEFILAMHLTNAKVKLKIDLPERLPTELLLLAKQNAA